MLQHDAAELLDLLHALLALRVVKRDDEVAGRRHLRTLADCLPRRQEVREADDSKVVHERRAEDGSRGIDGRDAGNHAAKIRAFCRGLLQHQFEHEPGHAVDAGIAARDDDRLLSRGSRFDCHAAAVNLLHHARSDDLLV